MLVVIGFTSFALSPLLEVHGTVLPVPEHPLPIQPRFPVTARQQITGSLLCSTTEFLSRGDFESSASFPWMLKAHSSFWLKSGLSVLSTYENQPWVFAQINDRVSTVAVGSPDLHLSVGSALPVVDLEDVGVGLWLATPSFTTELKIWTW